ncbi:hypothetical protein MRB53_037259 [Persea americana]|nr:hypothetical protein MRB53_037259 [Persea americana]
MPVLAPYETTSKEKALSSAVIYAFNSTSSLRVCSNNLPHNMAFESLIIQQEEPGDDPVTDAIFEKLCKAVQPESTAEDLELAIPEIVSLIPEGSNYGVEMSAFIWCFVEVATQIPYTHPSMIKLATLLDRCLKSSHFDKGESEISRYQQLGEKARSMLNGARLYERGIFTGGYELVEWPIADAFKEEKSPTWSQTCFSLFSQRPKPPFDDLNNQSQDTWTRVALNYLIINGDGLYGEVHKGELDLKKWQYWLQQAALVSKQGKISDGTLKLKKWQRWLHRDEPVVFEQETIDLAGQAVVAMQAAQRIKA